MSLPDYVSRAQREREPKQLSPKTIAVRISVAFIGVALFFAIFVLPWMFR